MHCYFKVNKDGCEVSRSNDFDEFKISKVTSLIGSAIHSRCFYQRAQSILESFELLSRCQPAIKCSPRENRGIGNLSKVSVCPYYPFLLQWQIKVHLIGPKLHVCTKFSYCLQSLKCIHKQINSFTILKANKSPGIFFNKLNKSIYEIMQC